MSRAEQVIAEVRRASDLGAVSVTFRMDSARECRELISECDSMGSSAGHRVEYGHDSGDDLMWSGRVGGTSVTVVCKAPG